MEWNELFTLLDNEQDPGKRVSLLKDVVCVQRDYDEWYRLECKSLKVTDKGLTKDSRGDLAQEVSAFANAGGGLIVWGFDVSDSVALPEAKPIDNVTKAHRALNRLLKEATEPAVDDARTILVIEDSAKDRGYLVTYVARSEGGPHRAAMGPKEIKDKYYRRRVDKSGVMSHDELEDMFGRRPHPIVLPEFILQRTPNEGFTLDVQLWNLGRGTAKWASIEMHIRPPAARWKNHNDRSTPLRWGIDVKVGDYSPHYTIYKSAPLSEWDGIIYPQDHVRHVRLALSQNEREKLEHAAIRVDWRISCEHMRTDIKGTFEICDPGFPMDVGKTTPLSSFREVPNLGKPWYELIPMPTNAYYRAEADTKRTT